MTVHARFPPTRGSVVLAAAHGDGEVRREALERLAASYWRPVYAYLRLRWRAAREDAEDMTQEFFAHALAKETFARFDPAKGRFRTFLRTCLDGFATNWRKAERRLKRGGGGERLPLDFAGAEAELARLAVEEAAALSPEELFHREWARGLFARAVGELRAATLAAGRTAHWALFERYDLEGPDAAERPTYGALAAELGLTTVQVTNYLAAMRRDLRRLVLTELRAATGSEAEYRAEARALLGSGAG